MKILFVCSANICRSPIAEGIMRLFCPSAEIDSAGLYATDGNIVDPLAVACAARHGIDISGLRSRSIRASDFADFDLILTMDEFASAFIEQQRPTGAVQYRRAEIENLAFYAGISKIPNPYGTTNFDAVYDLIEKACWNLAAKVQESLASKAL